MPIARVQMPDGRVARFEVPEGTTPQQVEAFAKGSAPKETGWRENLSGMAHEYLPMIGGTAGSIVGGGGALIAGNLGPQALVPEEVVTVPAAAVAGGAVGTGIGEQGADILDQWLGLAKGQSLPEAAAQAGANLFEGAKAETLGLVGGAALAKGAGAVKHVADRTGFTRAAENKVADALAGMSRDGDRAALAGTRELQEKVPGLQVTHGMGTGNREAVALERGAINSGQEGFGPIKQQTGDLQQANVQAVSRKLEGIVPGRSEDLTAELAKQKGAMDAQRAELRWVETPGPAARDAISEAQEPVKGAMERLEQAVPRYPMTLDNTKAVAKEILSDPRIPVEARNAVAGALKTISEQAAKHGENTHTLFGARRTVNGLAKSAYSREGGEYSGALLTRLREGIDADFAELGAKARTGQVKVHEGQVYSPDALAAELEENAVKIADLSAHQTPDVAAIQKELGPSAMRVTGESEQGFAKRIAAAYEKSTGKGVPMTGGAGAAQKIADLTGRNQRVRTILSELEPGQDVAALLNAYNDYASTRYFDRFKTRAVKQATSQATPLEGVTKKFSTPTGAGDLVKAVGRDKARDLMRAHYQADFSRLLDRNPTDAQLARWFADNRKVMKITGLDKEMFETVSGQRGYRELEKTLGSDPQSLFGQILSGNRKQQYQALRPVLARVRNNPAAMNGLKKSFTEYLDTEVIVPLAAGKEGFGRVEKVMGQLDPTIKALFSPKEQAALKAVRDAVKVAQRITEGSPLGGSHTSEILTTGAREIIAGRKANPVLSSLISASIAGLGALKGGAAGFGGGVLAATGLDVARTAVRQHGDDVVRATYARAMFDPDYAQALIKLSRERSANGAAAKEWAGKVGYMAGKLAGAQN